MSNRANDADHLSNAEKTLRGLRHIGSAQLITQIVTWGFTAITIHLLQPRDYGLIATSGIVTTLAQLLMDGGLSEVLIAQKELPSIVQGAATNAVLLVSALLGGIVFLIAPSVSGFFRSPPLQKILEVSALYFPLAALEVVPKALLSKRMRFGQIALAQTVGSIIQGATTLWMAYAGAAYWALIIGNFVGSGLRIGLLWLFVDPKPAPNLSLGAIRPLIRNSGHMIGMRFIWFMIDNFDLFILSRIAGQTALGAYSVARTLSYSAMNQIGSIVNQVGVPAFAAKTSKDDQLQGLLSIMSISSVLFFPLFWMMGVVAPIALPLVFGAKWGAMVIPFVAFTVILPLRSINTLLNAAVLGTGRTGMTLQITLSWAAISLPLMLVGVIKGANGVALSWTVGFPLVFYVAVHRIAREFHVKARSFIGPMVKPAVCAALSALASAAVPLYFKGELQAEVMSHVVRAMIVTCQCGIGAVCYWFLLRFFGRDQHTATLSIIRRLIRI